MKDKMKDHLRTYFKIISENWRRGVIIALGSIMALFCLFYVVAYLLQDGYIDVKARDGFDKVFWDMWVRLIKFDVTADKDAILLEAFISNGKTIAYFLPFPALVRGILSVFNYGNYPVVSMLIGFTLFVVYSGFTFHLMMKIILPEVRINQAIKVSWYFLIIFGSPFLSMLVRPSTYWEAIVWGTTLYMICLYLSIAILFKSKKTSRLICFGVVCGLTLFTRPTYGVGVSVLFLLTILILFMNLLKTSNHKISLKQGAYYKNQLICVLILFCIFGTSLCALNFARWGNAFEFAPLDKHSFLIGKERGENFKKYGAFQIDRIPENISYYFFPSKDNFSSERPFIQIGNSNYFMGFAKDFDYREPTLPIPVIIPVFSLFALSGFILLIKNAMLSSHKNQSVMLQSSLLPAALSAWIPGIIMLPMTCQAVRYSSEFIPGIIFFSIYAIVLFLKSPFLTNFQQKNGRQLAVALNLVGIGILFFISIYIMTAGILAQRQSGVLTWYGVELKPSKIVSDSPLLFGAGEKK